MGYKRRKGNSMVKTAKKKRDLSYNGITYRSSLERTMGILLTEAGIEFRYEPIRIPIVDGFDFPFKSYERQTNSKGDMVNRGQKRTLGVTYTPDFVGDDFIIETKGYANESFPVRWKLFKKWLSEKSGKDPAKFVIYKPQKISECSEVIKLIKQHRNERGHSEGD